MNRQEIFDKVATHLLTQNEKSVDTEGSCQYRGPKGKMCAIGSLIPDDLYKPSFEGMVVDDLIESSFIAAGIRFDFLIPEDIDEEKGIEFLRDLQTIHDISYPHRWLEELNKFAEVENLDKTVLKYNSR